MIQRMQSLKAWLQQQGLPADSLRPASEDASFRRYFRLDGPGGETRIVMDAPPDREPLDAFIDIDRRLRKAGLSAPAIHAVDAARGFLLMEDLGDEPYLDALDENTADALYGDALQALQVMQTRVERENLPPYDEALLRREMALFHDWFLQRWLGLRLSADQQRLWWTSLDLLVTSALQQPRVFVHRDYHSRNLMRLQPRPGRPNPGLLDFQDAVQGPVTYDLVSLLRDCYIDWPLALQRRWLFGFLRQAQHLEGVDEDRFLQWFDRMGAQRHLKAIGIFARLHLRDGKPGYLRDIPRTLAYLVMEARQCPELEELLDSLELEDRLQQRLAEMP
jgi:aminoglycoside/choline kinase family phosphotransferase